MKEKIVFLCTGNSCRSQMAEGFALKYWGDKYQIYSAGTKKHGMNPRAIQVMKEIGVDLSNHYSKTLEELPKENFDFVFTVCSSANENCPYLPASKIVHHGFDDPPALTREMTNEEEILAIYRRVRDEIDEFIKNMEPHLK